MSAPWPKVKLEEVLTPIRREETVDPTREYRLLGIRLDGRGPFLRETLLGSQSSATKLYRVAHGDFIYSRLFASRGAFGVISKELDGCYVSGEFPTFSPVSDKIEPHFLFYWFRLSSVLARVEEDCTGSTPLTRNRFKEHFFLALEIPLPPLAEQRRIVARIEELAAKLNEAKRLRQEAHAYARGLLLSAYARLIEGAKYLPMGEVAPLVRRPVQVGASKQYHELGIRSFGNGTFHKPSVSGAGLGTKKIFHIEAGDLLFNIVFAWEGAVAVARKEDHGRVGSHRFLTCVPKSGLATAPFLCFHFLTERGLERLAEASPGGAGRNRTLGLKALERILVPVPPFEKQRWFDALQAEIDCLKHLKAETTAEHDALLPSILDKAFRGEL